MSIAITTIFQLSLIVFQLYVFIVRNKLKFRKFKKLYLGQHFNFKKIASSKFFHQVQNSFRKYENNEASLKDSDSYILSSYNKDLDWINEDLLCIDIDELCQTMLMTSFLTKNFKIVSIVYVYKSEFIESLVK